MSHLEKVRTAVNILLSKQESFTFRDLRLKVISLAVEGQDQPSLSTIRCYCYRFCVNKDVRKFYAPSIPMDNLTYWCSDTNRYVKYTPEAHSESSTNEENDVAINSAAIVSHKAANDENLLTRKKLICSLEKSCDVAAEFYVSESKSYTRRDFEKKGSLARHSSGVVYMYIAKGKDGGEGQVLYIGVTSRSPKARIHDQTSAHKETAWWPDWTTFRCMDISDETDRLTLELLLILAHSPEYNKKPGPRDVLVMFPEAA